MSMSGTRYQAVRAFYGELWNNIDPRLNGLFEDRYNLTEEEKKELEIVRNYLKRRIKEMETAGYKYQAGEEGWNHYRLDEPKSQQQVGPEDC